MRSKQPSHNFSHFQPGNSKTRTHNVSPNTLSPPPGLNTGSSFGRINLDSLKSRPTADDLNNNLKQRNLESAYQQRQYQQRQVQQQEGGGFVSVSFGSNTNQRPQKSLPPKKDFVSMQQALGFLNFINANPNDAFSHQTIPLQDLSQPTPTRRPMPPKPSSSLAEFPKKSSPFAPSDHLNHQTSTKSLTPDNLPQESHSSHQGSSLTQTKKKLNKNRAIKRIIETAFDILEKNYHFTADQHSLSEQQRSTSTQFNIYLKQYNRIIEQINSKEYEEIEKADLLYDRNEDELQEVFEYTVMDDFRERLSVMFSKEKLNKSNVALMIPAFRQCLVSLKLNELRIQPLSPQQQHPTTTTKTIKMSQIQNVEYFTHPYIFISLTITRDKTKSKEHLYLKFSSEENQDKWDRALYCCYMSRKMAKKGKLFEIEYPVEDVMKKEKDAFRKEEEFYDLGEDWHVVEKCFREGEGRMGDREKIGEKMAGTLRSPASINPTFTGVDTEIDGNMLSDRPDYMNLPKNRNLTEERVTISVNTPDGDEPRRMNTTHTKPLSSTSKYDTPFNNIEMMKTANMKKSQSRHDLLEGSALSFGGGNNLETNGKSFEHNNHVYEENPFSNNNTTTPMKRDTNPNNNNNGIKAVWDDQPQEQSNNNLSKKSSFNVNSPNPNPSTPLPNPTSDPYRANTLPFMSPSNSDTGLRKPGTNPFMKLLKIAESQNPNLSSSSLPLSPQAEQKLATKLLHLKRIRQLQKSNIRGIVCQKEKFFMNKEKILFFYDQTLVNSARKSPTSSQGSIKALQDMKNISSEEIQANKYLEYWDYDYKKDAKEERKYIAVASIHQFQLIPSTLGQTTTSLLVGYSWTNADKKVDKKQLRLIFANGITTGGGNGMNGSTGNMSKANDVYEWIRLVKGI